ncbi:MAG: hypothetical protein QJR12_16985 [Mycobacterium sp.]|uniref:hypothetical protein n=1 Tax=Mycobacterium sp. TaxID=1785 RepID=UPI002628506C|nr:hypothetical protein [Mycobacterium sp.]MDI3315903.1 hypothetical protein [Mycobacterium sp.]
MALDYEPGTLGWWMDDRRAEFDLTWDQVAARAGVSKETLFRAAHGRPLRTRTKKAIERALHWASGSIDHIQAGGEPVDDSEPEARSDDELAELAELRRIAEDVKARAQESLAVARSLLDRIDRLAR